MGSPPYAVGHPSCNNYGMQPSYRYSGLCSGNGETSGYGASGNGLISGYGSTGIGNANNNYIGHGGFSYKTETYNPPTYQTAPSGPSGPTVGQQQQSAPAAPLQNVFKPIVEAVVHPVNNFINTDYSFKSIFDRFKDVLNLQRVSVRIPNLFSVLVVPKA